VDSLDDLELSSCWIKLTELINSLNVSHLQVCKEVNVKGPAYSQGFCVTSSYSACHKGNSFWEIQLIIISLCVYFIVALRYGDLHADSGIVCHWIILQHISLCQIMKC
jgi:hypothetical protein